MTKGIKGTKGSVLVLGATGQVGRAAVTALAADGWEVRAVSRGGGRDDTWPAKVRTVSADREDDAALAAALGDGCDVLVDMVAYGQNHARQLRGFADRIGSAVVISSGAVYEDDQGRSFDTQDEPDGFPRYPVPILETQRTVAPSDATYGTRKVALERELLAAGDELPVTLLRAGAIHGPYCPGPRELYFVKRALDRRPVRILAYNGESRFHPVHVSNIAELIRLAAAKPGSRVLNAGDPEVPTVAEISAGVDAALGVPSETVLVDGPAPVGAVGLTPWGEDRPIVFDMSAAERELGYRAVTSYAASLPATVEWLARRIEGRDIREWRDWAEIFRNLANYEDDWFDYAAEDSWLKQR
ncbi:NAD-dependent epimerase/dehydratase family protein [Streptomyces sp. NPDC052236]|uniref:NAD-dependent epimerase/dehydratase family protein n=1 Tax=Streptomyces sp. NPDC052236 TaxID=3365686 RepID=UPI0037D0AF3D